MFIFVREGRYVTATNKFWFWISILSALVGTVMGFILLKKAGQPVLGVIMALLFIGCVVFAVLFLSTVHRSHSIIACGFGIAATLIPCILQCINLETNTYIPMAGFSILTIISNVWALAGSKNLYQDRDETVKACMTLKGSRSRIPMIILYVLAAVGIILALAAVISGTLPVYPD